MRESDILYEAGNFWVMKDKHNGAVTFTVMKNVGTHAVSVDDVLYPDITLAKYRVDYLNKRKQKL